MPHEYLDYDHDSAEGLLLSADLLTAYKTAEVEAQQREQNKTPKMREGQTRAGKAKHAMPGRMANLGKKRK
jgi:hypothetical protein